MLLFKLIPSLRGRFMSEVMTEEVQELYQELILDHGLNPRNNCVLNDANKTAKGFNPLCGDKVEIFLIVDDHQIIKKVSFVAAGCAISIASASFMTEILIGKTINDALELASAFQLMVTTDNGCSPNLGKLAVLQGVKSFPARVKCATLGWHALREALGGNLIDRNRNPKLELL